MGCQVVSAAFVELRSQVDKPDPITQQTQMPQRIWSTIAAAVKNGTVKRIGRAFKLATSP